MQLGLSPAESTGRTYLEATYDMTLPECQDFLGQSIEENNAHRRHVGINASFAVGAAAGLVVGAAIMYYLTTS